MENNRVVYAVADNIISSAGLTTESVLRSIQNEESGISFVSDRKICPQGCYVSKIDWSEVAKLKGFQDVEGYNPLEKLMILSVKEALSHCDIDPSSSDTVFIFSTTKGNVDLIEGRGTDLPDEALLYNMAARVANFFDAAMKPFVISNACISGVLAISVAQRLIKSGKYCNAIVVGGDLLTEFIMSGFQSFKSVSPQPCKPYDKSRDGLTVGEGVATLVLSCDKQLVKDDVPVMVAGSSSSNDANHISGPSRTGDGLAFAIEDALAEAGVLAKDVDLVDMHGTATLYNDEMESKALALANLAEKPLLSLKGYFGHTMGASGLIETIVCIEAIRRQMQFRTLGFEELGVPVEVNVTKETKPLELKNVLKTASGFGGCNAAILLSTVTAGMDFGRFAEISVSKSCVIEDEKVVVDGNVLFDGSEFAGDYPSFIRKAFKEISAPYMKFAKMDDLSKLGLTAVEYLLQDERVKERFAARDIAVLLSNKHSSLDTDVKHQLSLDNKEAGQPSPAVFVYTLPNIVMGEICIRHKLQGENTFLIFDKEDKNLFVEWSSILFSLGKAKACITGWVDFFDGKYRARVVLLEEKGFDK